MHRSRQVAAIVLAATVLLSVAPMAQAGSQTALGAGSSGPHAAQEITGSFSQSTYRVVRGETVEITFSHSGPATLRVGGDEAGYLLQVNVSGSGKSTVTIDTYASTSSDPDSYVEGGDASLVYPQGGLAKSLVAAPYTLNLTVEGVEQDLGLLVIEERPPANMTANVAPGTLNLGDIDHETLKGSLTPRQTVAKGDYAVLEINATGLGNAIDPDSLHGGSSANGIEVFFEDLDAQPNKAAQDFDGGDADVDAFWNEETGSLLVVWDTEDVVLYGGRHSYNVSLAIEADHNELLEEDTVESHTEITVVTPQIRVDTGDGQLEVYPWESDVISIEGTTNLAPGSPFQFRAQAFEPRPFLKKSQTEVSENGTVEAEMDLGDVARGIEFPLWVLGHRDVSQWTISLRESAAVFTFENQTAESGEVARIENVSLSVGGFLVVEDRNGTRLGVSDPIGETARNPVTVDLEPPLNRSAYLTVRAYMDWNQNRSFEPGVDRPYTRNETNVSQTAVVFVPETGEPVVPAETNETTTTMSTNSTANNSTTGPTTQTMTTLTVQAQEPITPGTTSSQAPLSLAITTVALLAAALLFGWRRS